MPEPPEPSIYQLKAVLLGISPIIWRRLLVRADSTIADLHDTLQIAFGWSGDHLHRFLIHGKQYGVAYLDGITFHDDPRLIKLSDLGGPWAFMERRDEVPCEVWGRFWSLKEVVDAGDLDAVREQMESLESIREWLTLGRFDRQAINRRLEQDV